MSDHEDAEAKRIGRLIAKLRRKQGWSQQDLAHQLSMHVSTVSRWERGEHEGYAVNARKLAKALKVHPSLLRPVELDVETQLDRIEGRLEELYAMLTEPAGAARAAAALGARAVEAAESTPPPAPEPQAKRAAARRRKSA